MRRVFVQRDKLCFVHSAQCTELQSNTVVHWMSECRQCNCNIKIVLKCIHPQPVNSLTLSRIPLRLCYVNRFICASHLFSRNRRDHTGCFWYLFLSFSPVCVRSFCLLLVQLMPPPLPSLPLLLMLRFILYFYRWRRRKMDTNANKTYFVRLRMQCIYDVCVYWRMEMCLAFLCPIKYKIFKPWQHW